MESPQETNHGNPMMEFNQILVAMRKKLQAMTKPKKWSNATSGLACVEPCAFPRCMHSCWQDVDEQHTSHYCSIHKGVDKVKKVNQQIELSNEQEPMSVVQSLLQEKETKETVTKNTKEHRTT